MAGGVWSEGGEDEVARVAAVNSAEQCRGSEAAEAPAARQPVAGSRRRQDQRRPRRSAHSCAEQCSAVQRSARRRRRCGGMGGGARLGRVLAAQAGVLGADDRRSEWRERENQDATYQAVGDGDVGSRDLMVVRRRARGRAARRRRVHA